MAGLTWVVAAGYLPSLYIDATRQTPFVQYFAGAMWLLNAIAIVLLFVRRGPSSYLIDFLRRNLPEWDWDFPFLGGSSRITAVICGSPRPVRMAVLLKSLYQQHSNGAEILRRAIAMLKQALDQTSLPHWQTSEETNVRFGSLADILRCNRHVRFTP